MEFSSISRNHTNHNVDMIYFTIAAEVRSKCVSGPSLMIWDGGNIARPTRICFPLSSNMFMVSEASMEPWKWNRFELIVHFDKNYLYSSKFNKTISLMSAGNVIFYKNTISDITKWRKYLTQIIFNDFWMNIWNVKNWLFWDLKLARNFTRMKFYQHKISYKNSLISGLIFRLFDSWIYHFLVLISICRTTNSYCTIQKFCILHLFNCQLRTFW